MLMISEGQKANHSLTLQLEGRVVGPWVDELRKVCEPLLADEFTLTLDLAEVSFADKNGVKLLTSLSRRGVKLQRPTPFVAEQLKASASNAFQ
jgi:ABC-type transporter Mla MlaB component